MLKIEFTGNKEIAKKAFFIWFKNFLMALTIFGGIIFYVFLFLFLLIGHPIWAIIVFFSPMVILFSILSYMDTYNNLKKKGE